MKTKSKPQRTENISLRTQWLINIFWRGTMKKIILTILIILISSSLIYPQSKVGTTAAQFLKIGVGCRAESMGEAFIAVANDATALYWNPGGISRLPKNEVTFIHTDWLADTEFNFVGLVFKTGYGSLGFSVTSLTMADEAVRTVYEPEGTGEFFTAGDLALGLSYGRNLTDRFSFGITFKYVQQKIWRTSTSGIAFDIGTLFTTQFEKLRIGMSMSNFGSKLQLTGNNLSRFIDLDPTITGETDRVIADIKTKKWDMPLNFRIGISYDVFSTENHFLTMEVDAIHPNDLEEYMNIGAEYGFLSQIPIFIRGGYRRLLIDDNEGGLSLGGGLKLKFGDYANLKLDYAYSDWGRLNYVHRYSISVEF